MFILKSTGLMLGLAVLLGTLTSAPNLQSTIAQNATGNATNAGHTEGLIVRGQSTAQPVSTVDCMFAKKQVPTLGLGFTAINDSGKVDGWWNIPSSEGGNNVGGKISNVKVDKNMFEVKGTMNYDYLCAKKNNLNYEISITGNCGGNGTITFKSSSEISSHNFTGSVTC
jgi:hypothetical protein